MLGTDQAYLSPAFAPPPPSPPRSAFDNVGLQSAVKELVDEIRALYLDDAVPWVVGYSGGKDSTAVLMLVWMALASIEPARRTKAVHVISTDTLVENPAIATWAGASLGKMTLSAAEQGLPVEAHRLSPTVDQSFWVMLIGRGYPAPSRDFRWCTDRMKIRPSTLFMSCLISDAGSAIVVLGTRKAESQGRRARMEKLEAGRLRERLSPNASQPGSLVYSPIEDWSNDDVWMFILQYENPWGHSNKDLLALYRGASPDNECPVVLDKGTPSCGGSRFGCWTCTVVEQDKSLEAMVTNEVAHEWMRPLLELRDELAAPDYHLRDFRRMNGLVQLRGKGPHAGTKATPGPYTQASRAMWLRKLLVAQEAARQLGPNPSIELITHPELEAIRVIWVVEKLELEDLLPSIYEEATGRPFVGAPLPFGPFSASDLAHLRESAGDEEMYALVRSLLGVVVRRQHGSVRAGVYGELERTIRRHLYPNEEEATAAAILRDKTTEEALLLSQSIRAANALKEAAGQITTDIGTTMVTTGMLIEKGN